jgi:hypothetical protein
LVILHTTHCTLISVAITTVRFSIFLNLDYLKLTRDKGDNSICHLITAMCYNIIYQFSVCSNTRNLTSCNIKFADQQVIHDINFNR